MTAARSRHRATGRSVLAVVAAATLAATVLTGGGDAPAEAGPATSPLSASTLAPTATSTAVTWTGDLERSYTFDRYRDGARTMYEGPEVWGNATSYGRALFTVQHLMGADGKERARIEMWDRRVELTYFIQLAGWFRNSHPAMAELGGCSSAMAEPRWLFFGRGCSSVVGDLRSWVIFGRG